MPVDPNKQIHKQARGGLLRGRRNIKLDSFQDINCNVDVTKRTALKSHSKSVLGGKQANVTSGSGKSPRAKTGLPLSTPFLCVCCETPKLSATQGLMLDFFSDSNNCLWNLIQILSQKLPTIKHTSPSSLVLLKFHLNKNYSSLSGYIFLNNSSVNAICFCRLCQSQFPLWMNVSNVRIQNTTSLRHKLH